MRNTAVRILSHAALVIALILGTSQLGRAQQVFVGSANGWDAMNAHPEQWKFVRSQADGFYVNFIQMRDPSVKKCALTCSLSAHKNAYYESDSRYTGLGGFPDGGQFSRALQSQELFALLNGGFMVPYTSLNYGVDDVKLDDLRHLGLAKGVTRPCFAQNGPWTFGGDIMKDVGDNAQMRKDTARTDGASTDGPLSLWQADQGGMRAGSFSVVTYAHSLHKTAAVMVAPYDLKPASQWLALAQQCVRQHEDAGAWPDIWIVFEYATDTPTLPEMSGGLPADTITGVAYWLIHHVKDPDHAARMTAEPLDAQAMTQTVMLHNSSQWLDLCPTLTAEVAGPHPGWEIRYVVDGQDVTSQITESAGLPFVGRLRLWPSTSRRVQVAWKRLSPAGLHEKRPAVTLRLRPSVSIQGNVSQALTLR